MDDSDDLQILINYNNSEDYSLGVRKVIDQSLKRSDYSDYYSVIENSNIGVSDDTWKDQGSEIDVKGVGSIGVDFIYTNNNSDGGVFLRQPNKIIQ